MSLATILSDEENCLSSSEESKEEEFLLPSPTLPPPYIMSQQQTAAPTIEQILQFMAQQLKAITVLQQQLLAAQAAIATPAVAVAPALVTASVVVEVAPPPKFNGERSQMVGFINTYHLFMQIRLTQVAERNKISWVLSYVQGGVAKIWKDNILDEITKGTLVL